MISRPLFVCAALSLASASVFAQQLVTRLTGPECTARGGSIRTWTSTAGIVPQRGECWIPPRIGSRGGAARGGGGGSAAASLGAAAGVAGALGNFIDTLNEIEADRQERERQWEEGLRAEREQWLDQTVAREGDLMQREAGLRAREQQQADDAGTNPFAAPNPFAAAAPFDPGAMQPQPYNSSDPDLAKCREGSAQPWTIAGCYDMQAKGAAKPDESLRDQLRRSLADGNDEAAQDEPSAQPAQVATAPRVAPPPQKPAEAAPVQAIGPWAKGPWRTRDERACRGAGGVLVNPRSAGDMTGIPQVVLDNPEVPRAQLAATPYCMAVGTVNPVETQRAVRGLVGSNPP